MNAYMKCQRCRKKSAGVSSTLIAGQMRDLCDQCFQRWLETENLVRVAFIKGRLYPKEGKLFLASEGTYGGILRG